MFLRLAAPLAAAVAAALAPAALAQGPAAGPIDPPPTAADWAALARLPDWSGVWTPNISDQKRPDRRRPGPLDRRRGQADRRAERRGAGRRSARPVRPTACPEGMPSWMLISHNALEFLFTPGRVTLLGESDSNRLRRIYTDGRPHPDDPDLTFHGDSIGRWDGDTLVVDTIGVLPEVYLAVSEAIGVPNNGDLHVVERIHLAGPDELHDDLEITAPHILTRPWKTTRIYYRQRARRFAIVEGVCLQGAFSERTDKDGKRRLRPPSPTTEASRFPPRPDVPSSHRHDPPYTEPSPRSCSRSARCSPRPGRSPTTPSPCSTSPGP
ncbi:MAG: hypothetical protein WDM92_01055 [Caulobacteraceae bacterium]